MKTALFLLVIVVLLAAPAHLVRAQSGGGYDLTWYTVDGGGVTFNAGGGYQLGGTLGQFDANTLNGGGYTLMGGFWYGGRLTAPDYKVYLPLVIR